MKFKLASLAILSALASLPQIASAQSTWTGVTASQWGTASNWSVGVPNALDAVANVDTTAAAVTINLSDTGTAGLYPYTAGAITKIGTPDLFLGNASVTTDQLTLATSTGSPVLTVSAGNMYFYLNFLGNQGFTKSGSGKGTFRFNVSPQTYSGNVTISAGTLGIQQDSSLGDSGNDIIFSGTSTLMTEPGSNTGPVTLGPGRDITINTGVTATLRNIAAAVTTTVQGSIKGPGNLVVFGTGALELQGVNSYAGTTTLNGPGQISNSTVSNLLKISGAGTLPASTRLITAFGTGIATGNNATINIDLGGTSQAVSGITFTGSSMNAGSSADSSAVLNITNGTLVSTSPTLTLNIAASGSNDTAQINLPDSATLTALALNVANVGSSVSTTVNFGLLRIGASATLNMDNITLGAYRARGTINALTAGSNLKLRATDGSNRVSQILIGNFSGGVNPFASIDMLNGSVDITATDIILSRSNVNFNTTGTLLFGGGTLDATTLTLGDGVSASTSVITAVATQAGGTAKVSRLNLGRAGSTTSDRFVSQYILQGGTLRAGTITIDGASAYSDLTKREIVWSGGSIANYDATTDLSIVGGAANAGGVIKLISSTAAAKSFNVDSGRSLTLGAKTALSSADATVVVDKDGAGTLVLGGSTAGFTGTLRHNTGALELGAVDAIAAVSAGSFTWNGGVLNYDLSGTSNADVLTLTGGLTKGAAPSYTFDFGGGGVAAGDYTLATFATTDFVAGDFVCTNLVSGLVGAFVVDGTSLRLTVSAASTATALETWREAKFGAPDNIGDAADAADPDHDGRANLLEYATGTEPLTADSGSLTTIGQAAGKLTLTFNRIADPLLTYTVRGSNDLTAPWTTPAVFTSTGGANTAGEITVEDTALISASSRRFLRLEVSY